MKKLYPQNQAKPMAFASSMMTIALFACFLFSGADCFAADKSKDNNSIVEQSNQQMLAQYVQSKGPGIIVFDASNIKQFWIDPSVLSKNDSIIISLNEKELLESTPLKIQLANVNEAQDCMVEVITDTKNARFSVLDSKKNVLSSSQKETDFIDYSVLSSVFHLEDTIGLSFSLKFYAKQTTISIKKIILSFSKNKNSSFLVSPGELHITSNNITVRDGRKDIEAKKISDTSFSTTGTRSVVFSQKKILVSDNPISTTVTIKNTGNTQTSISFALGCYSKDRDWINARNYPYMNLNNVLNVVSFVEEENKIIVDRYSDWLKDCSLALNAKEDMSDIPTSTFADGTIVEVKELEDERAEIIMSAPLKSKIKNGMKVRITGHPGSYLYPKTLILEPGEEQTVTSIIARDEKLLQYSSKAITRGVYYIIPLILSYSVDSSKENTILISDFTVSY